MPSTRKALLATRADASKHQGDFRTIVQGVDDTLEADGHVLSRDRLLDALVFSSPGRPWRDVMVAGRWVVRDHRHAAAQVIASNFTAAMADLASTL